MAKRISDKNNSRRKIAQAIEANKTRYRDKLDMYKDWVTKEMIDSLDPTVYGSRVRGIREKNGYSGDQLATSIGTTNQNLSKIENGQFKRLNLDLMWLICAVFDTNPCYLFGKTDSPGEAQFIDGKGRTRTSREPVKFMEPDYAHLVTEIENGFHTEPELCQAFLRILSSKHSEAISRAKNALIGICASCLDF